MKYNKLLLLPLTLLLSSCVVFNSSSEYSSQEDNTEENSSLDNSSNETTTTSEETSISSNTSNEEITNHDSSSNEDSTTENNDQTDILLNEDMYDEFWNETSLTNFRLDFKGDTLKYLSEYGKETNSPNAEMYFPADLYITLNGKNYFYKDVGVRTKGNVFSRYELFDHGNYNGNRIHLKINFNETFDDENLYKGEVAKFKIDWTNKEAEYKLRDDRTLCGMKKLDLKFNKDNDPTFLRQAYATKILREYGQMAARVGLINLDVQMDSKTVYSDLYQTIEVINKQFLKKNLSKSEAKGDLYKCGWTDVGTDLCKDGAIKLDSSGNYVADYKIGVEDKLNNKYYVYDLKTNEDSSDHSSLVNLIRVLDENSTVPTYFEDLENVLDLESFAVQQAVSYVIGSPDDLRNNLNNTYIYFNPVNQKAYIIPTDFDQCLGINVGNMGNYWPTSTKFQGYKNGSGYLYQPLYWKTILVSDGSSTGSDYSSKWPSHSLSKSIYKDTLYKLASDPLLTEEAFKSFASQFPLHTTLESSGNNYTNIGDYFNSVINQINSDSRLANY